jgi:hypothetical protein
MDLSALTTECDEDVAGTQCWCQPECHALLLMSLQVPRSSAITKEWTDCTTVTKHVTATGYQMIGDN